MEEAAGAAGSMFWEAMTASVTVERNIVGRTGRMMELAEPAAGTFYSELSRDELVRQKRNGSGRVGSARERFPRFSEAKRSNRWVIQNNKQKQDKQIVLLSSGDE